jgi:hypothetical protein
MRSLAAPQLIKPGDTFEVEADGCVRDSAAAVCRKMPARKILSFRSPADTGLVRMLFLLQRAEELGPIAAQLPDVAIVGTIPAAFAYTKQSPPQEHHPRSPCRSIAFLIDSDGTFMINHYHISGLSQSGMRNPPACQRARNSREARGFGVDALSANSFSSGN